MMSDKVYTREGVKTVGGYDKQVPIKTYRVPTETGDEIRINVPYSATKRNVEMAADLMQVIAKYMDEDDEV